AGAPRKLRPNRFMLGGAELSGLVLFDADLSNAELQKANLKGTDLTCANLQYASLDGSDLAGASLEYAKIQGATFAESRLDFASMGAGEGQAAAWSPASAVGLTMSLPGQIGGSRLRLHLVIPPLSAQASGVSISSDGLLIAAAAGASIRIYDL